ncbi:acyltransferase family protein [Leifsonia sp. LS-T14]|uniref:acyltransferase family protein n=1 Tax=unclassified Leifsonia TaxID=2663824 RepID=UPI0035A60B2D
MNRVSAYLFKPLYTHADFLAMRHFGGFDGVRALAALMVVFFHFGGPKAAFTNGWIGVQLFFVLSGFLITTLLLREERMNGRISLGNFWIRRLFRILPAYYLVLAVTVLLLVAHGSFDDAGGPQSIWFFVTMNPEFAPTAMNFGQAWTIGIEQKFYLIWPLLAFVFIGPFLLKRLAAWALLVVGVVACSLLFYQGLIHYAVILLGCGLAMVLNSARGFRAVRFVTTRFFAVLALLVLVVLQIEAGAISVAFRGQDPTVFIYGIVAALALPGLCAPTPTARVLAWGPFRWLGQRSYSIYLVQLIAAGVVGSVFAAAGVGLLMATLVAIVSALMADLIFRWVEQPAIQAAKRITRRRDPEKLVTAKVAQIG